MAQYFYKSKDGLVHRFSCVFGLNRCFQGCKIADGIISLKLGKNEAEADLSTGRIKCNGKAVDLGLDKEILEGISQFFPACLNRCSIQYSTTRCDGERIHVIGWRASISDREYVRQVALHEDGRFELWKN